MKTEILKKNPTQPLKTRELWKTAVKWESWMTSVVVWYGLNVI